MFWSSYSGLEGTLSTWQQHSIHTVLFIARLLTAEWVTALLYSTNDVACCAMHSSVTKIISMAHDASTGKIITELLLLRYTLVSINGEGYCSRTQGTTISLSVGEESALK